MKAHALFRIVAVLSLFVCTAVAKDAPAPAVRKNIPYGTEGITQQNFDFHPPVNKTGKPAPLIFWIHGGAWMMGSKDWINVGYLVKQGYAIASVDYRFSKEAPFPAQIQDCNAALNFILAHADEYGIDPKRFVIGGGSAGGHLALLLGLARNEKAFGADPTLKPLAILDFFGPADFDGLPDDLKAMHSDKGLQLFQDAVPKLLGVPLAQIGEKTKAASPLTYVTAGAPPVLIVHGDKDDSVPLAQSQRLHEAFDKAGVKNQIIVLEGAPHDGPRFSTPDVESKVEAFLNGIVGSPSSN